MSGQTRTRSLGTIVLSMVLATLVAGLAPVAGRGPLARADTRAERSADLAPTIGADGRFRGATDVSGMVDTSAWTLVSDLAAGEPPRFAPATSHIPRPPAIGSWSALGSNGAGNGALNAGVYALAVSGANLYVGGSFTNAAGIPAADYIAKWDGSAWSALGSNGSGNGAIPEDPSRSTYVDAITVSGTDVYAGGSFSNVALMPTADWIAKWNGSAWSALGDNGAGNGALDDRVNAIAVSGTNLYVGGLFSNAAGNAKADKIASWNGSSWSPLGSNGSGDGALNNGAYALAVSGPNLYVGGTFTDAAGIPTADGIARWDGSIWAAVGSNGAGDGALNANVTALALSGPNLYVGGFFTNAAGLPAADYVARWNGSAWSALGSNGAGGGALGDIVFGLAVSGTKLYVSGDFTNAAGIPTADHVARWDGSSWSGLGSNGAGDGAINNHVVYVAVSGNDLFVGGSFTDAAGIPEADYVAEWRSGSPQKPDGRIRQGIGAYVGNDAYNADARGQKRRGSAAIRHSITFGISVQNDGTSPDKFLIKATGAGVTGYKVKWFDGTTDITLAVEAGTAVIAVLAPGASHDITAVVKVRASAAIGSRVKRLLTITSVGDPSRVDAVKFRAMRG